MCAIIILPADPAGRMPSQSNVDTSIEDYINNKFRCLSDIEGLESLISNVESQQKQLKEQLQDAQQKLSDAKVASTKQAAAMLKEISDFESQQASLQKRLMAITSSETPEIAMAKLQAPMKKLWRLESAYAYVNLLKNVESLKNDARKYLLGNPKLALESYAQLQKISELLLNSHENAEGTTIHLNTYLQETTINLWTEMKKLVCDDFESVLQKYNWPDPNLTVSQEWINSFRRLLDFQSEETKKIKEVHILLPLKVMAKIFVLQFQYHFSGNKPTSDPHKLGDYFLDWFLSTVAKMEGFLLQNVKPILASYFKGRPFFGNMSHLNPIAAFISSLLPVLREKVVSLTEEISTQPQLLSQFITQLMDFDDSVRSRFKYCGSDSDSGWRGLTMHVLDIYFEKWYEIEKNFALDRYREIIQEKSSGEIDYDSYPLGKTKSTFGATQVTDLISNITFKYQKVQSFEYKMKFLIGIQAEILDLYSGRLNDALEYYHTAHSTVGRTIHGVTREELEELRGIKGLDKLCRVFGSANHLISMLKDWTNEEFFIILHDDLRNRKESVDLADCVPHLMTAGLVKECPSNSIESDNDGTLFDTTLETFRHLRNTAESLIAQAIKYDLPSEFRLYITKSHWTTVGDVYSLDSQNMLISPELEHPLQTLRNYMHFLHRNLADAPFRRIFREVFKALQDLLFSDLLLRQDFTSLGSVRFSQDIAAIQALIGSSIPARYHVPLHMSMLREGATLLSLPYTAEESKLSYEEVSRAIFSSNQEATQILALLGMTHLSNTDARSILERRIDERNVDKGVMES